VLSKMKFNSFSSTRSEYGSMSGSCRHADIRRNVQEQVDLLKDLGSRFREERQIDKMKKILD